MRIELKKIITNIVAPVFIIFIAEVFFRHLHNLRYDKIFDSLIFIGFFVVALHHIKSKITASVVLFYIVFSYASQMINMAIYGYWLPPMNIVLMIEKFGETFRSGQDSFASAVPSLIVVTLVSFVFILVRLRKSHRRSYFFDLAVLLLLIVQPLKILSSPLTTQGENPDSRYSAIKAGYYANGYLLGRILPNMITKKEHYPEYKAEEPPKLIPNKVNNIILVVGESLSVNNMSVFDYERKTTPWLNIQKEAHESIIKKTYSSGVFTDITLPSFFNMIPTPNGDRQISSRNTNLFRMAKENGYNTHFYSAQNKDGMALINKVGLEYIDKHTFSTELGYDNYTSAYDIEIIKYLDNINWAESNFIVLHQVGSHSPYSQRVPNNFKPFGTGNYQNDYDNTA